LGCLGIHSFDLATFLVGANPIQVTGWIDEPILRNPRGDHFIDPGGSVVMNFSNQVKAFILQVEDGSGPMSVELNLTGARIKIDEKSGNVEITKRDTTQKPGPGILAKFETVTLPPGLTAKTNMLVMLEGVLRELIESKPLISGGDAGKLSMEVLVAAYVSSEMGHIPVSLPLTKPDHIKKYLTIT
jgi:predicted dehydrogenase